MTKEEFFANPPEKFEIVSEVIGKLTEWTDDWSGKKCKGYRFEIVNMTLDNIWRRISDGQKIKVVVVRGSGWAKVKICNGGRSFVCRFYTDIPEDQPRFVAIENARGSAQELAHTLQCEVEEKEEVKK